MLEDKIKDMQLGFTKEITFLREKLRAGSFLPEDLNINCYFFEPSDLLDKRTRSMLNMKLENLQTQFTERMAALHTDNKSLHKKIV